MVTRVEGCTLIQWLSDETRVCRNRRPTIQWPQNKAESTSAASSCMKKGSAQRVRADHSNGLEAGNTDLVALRGAKQAFSKRDF